MLVLDLTPFPELQTANLHMRAVKPSDVHEVFAMRSDPEMMQYIGRALMKTLQDAEEHIKKIEEGIAKREHINWAITLKGNDKLIGIIGFYRMELEHYRSEVGYMLSKEYHKRGIMTEALTAIVDHGFKKFKFHQIEAIIAKDNAASENLLLKNGFVLVAHFRENYFFEGQFLDSVHYTKITQEK